MCTLTIISLANDPDETSLREGYRVVVNRDESRKRPPATPPRRHEVDGLACVWPTDPLAGGTWIAAAETGLTLAILNGAPTPMPPMPPKDRLTTRGLIVPTLLSSPDAETAAARLADEFDLDAFAPFRFVAIDRARVVDLFWNRSGLARAEQATTPLCYVSSGLGDAKVAGRLDVFAEWWTEGVTPERQDGYHLHRWAHKPELSVMMARPDARTVSQTVVETSFTDDEVRVSMRYADVDEQAARPHDRVIETVIRATDRAAC
jgi:hypothetical protein